MNTKLTLNLNKNTIEEAKKYAKNQKISLSKLIEHYLKSLTNEKEGTNEVSPLVKSLTGIIDSAVDERKEYRDYLSKKHG